MNTSDVQLQQTSPPDEGLVYDGFISYSHAADDLLAPRLQAGLQRFAKPWWRRRALRVFRDEASLSANPHLWSSITEALDSSGWFILLLSPDAAASKWVNQEIEHWITHKDSDRILPVVTDGEFGWGTGEVVGDAVPPALDGVFSDEPRWVDLRFARDEEQLDLKNPLFLGVVADVASAMRGVPKDELESEEVRQHRRTVRTAWAAAVSLIVLASLAVAAAVFAFDQQAEAQTQASLAAEQATLAADQADVARSERDRAVLAEQDADAQRVEAEKATEAEAAARVAAEEATALAQARQVVLEAEKVVEFDPELSMHLALFALSKLEEAGEDPAQAVAALRAAIAANRVVERLSLPSNDGVAALAVHPDGGRLAVALGRLYRVIDLTSGEMVEQRGGSWHRIWSMAYSPDGALLALAVQEAESDPLQVTVWDQATGEEISIEDGGGSLVFSPDGRYLAWETGSVVGVVVWSLSERRVVYRSNDGTWAAPDFGPNGLLAYGFGNRVRIVDPGTGSLVRSLFANVENAVETAWSPDGSLIAVYDHAIVVVINARSGAEISRASVVGFSAIRWLPGGDAFVIGGESGLNVIEASTGEVRMELLGLSSGSSYALAIIPGTNLLAAQPEVSDDVVVFDTSPLGGVEVGGWLTPLAKPGITRFVGDGTRVVTTDSEASFVSAGAESGEDPRIVNGPASVGSFSSLTLTGDGEWVASLGLDGRWAIRSTDTGETIYTAPGGWMIQGVSWDGAMAVIDAFTGRCETTLLVATGDGSTLGDLSPECESGEGYESRRFFFSPAGDLLVDPHLGEAWVIEDASLRFRGSSNALNNQGPKSVAFASDGSTLVVGTADGHLSVFRVAVLKGSGPEQALTRSIRVYDAPVASVSVSDDGSMAVTSAFGEPLRLWDLETGLLLGEFGGPVEAYEAHYGDFHPTSPHLLVVSPPNEVRVYTLDVDELVAIARARLTRQLTEAECQQYFHGSCASS